MNHAARVLWVLGLLLAPSAPAEGQATSPASGPVESFRLSDLEAGVRRWQHTGETPPGLPLDLSGFNFLWQASPGDGSHVAAISKVHGGYLALFAEGGDLLEILETDEIYYSVFLCDLDQDGVAEVITDQVTGFGTGYLDRNFHVYKRLADSLVDLGTRTSYRLVMMYPEEGEPYPQITRGYVRCDPGDGMQSMGLAYIVERSGESDDASTTRRSQLRIERGKLMEFPE